MEAIDDLSTFKEMSRSRTNSFSLCTDERSNFQSVVNKLEHEVKNLKLKLNESGNYHLFILLVNTIYKMYLKLLKHILLFYLLT